jgi:L-iditol 2-dehydrogenase
MKAVRVVGPRQMRLEEMPQPEPRPGDVLVRVAAVGVCQTDLEIMTGLHGWIASGDSRYPLTPGHEWSGYVEALGDGVAQLQVGDLVVGETGIGCGQCRWCLAGHHNICPDVTESGILGRDGAMREYHVQPATFVHRFPGDDPETAALTEPATVGVYACHQAAVSPLDRVAVVGCGTIGQFCVQAARAGGARYLLAVSRSEYKLRLAEQLGADLAVSSAERDPGQVAAEVTRGELFDVVIEAGGKAEALNAAVQLCGRNGRLVVVGYASPEPYGFSLQTIIDRELTLIGVRGSPNVYAQTIDLMARGAIRAEPLISARFPLQEYEAAFALAEAGQADVLKVLVKPSA